MPLSTLGPLVIDLAEYRVTRDGVEVRLTVTEFKLVAHLAANAGRVLTHHAILSAVWGPGACRAR
jgi:two-component system KDP operon response regulator KdpE